MFDETSRMIEACNGFNSCAELFSAGMTQHWATQAARGSAFEERARAMVVVYSFAFGSSLHRATKEIGFSVNEFKDLVANSGIMSRGRAGALLGHLRLLGFVKPDRESAPGLRLILKNSAEFLKYGAAGWSICYATSSPLLPKEMRLATPYCGEGRILEFARFVVPQVVQGWRPFIDLRVFQEYWQMRGGLRVLLGLYHYQDGEATSARALSNRFVIPRSQVTRLLKKGLAAGHFEDSNEGLLLGEHLRSEVKTAIARYFTMILVAAHGDIRGKLMESSG